MPHDAAKLPIAPLEHRLQSVIKRDRLVDTGAMLARELRRDPQLREQLSGPEKAPGFGPLPWSGPGAEKLQGWQVDSWPPDWPRKSLHPS